MLRSMLRERASGEPANTSNLIDEYSITNLVALSYILNVDVLVACHLFNAWMSDQKRNTVPCGGSFPLKLEAGIKTVLFMVPTSLSLAYFRMLPPQRFQLPAHCLPQKKEKQNGHR